MATYYIDYTGGSDGNNGTSEATPWKHLRGDTNATGVAAAATFAAGDVILFKRGVSYEGMISFGYSGSEGSPIVIKGDGSFGVGGKAKLQGSVAFTRSWTQCGSAEDVYGNSHYENIWSADIEFVGQTALHTLICDGVMMAFSQDVKPEAPILYDKVSAWATIPTASITSTTTTDASRFSQPDSSYWLEAWIARHIVGNAVTFQTVTSYDPGTSTVTTATNGTSFYAGTTRMSVMGHPLYITQAGEYAVKDGKIFFWAPASADPNALDIRVGKLKHAIVLPGRNDVTVEGFEVEGYFGGLSDGFYEGYAIGNNGSSDYNRIRIRDCDARFIRSLTAGPVFSLGRVANGSITGCTITDCLRSRGMILATCANVDVAQNSLNGVSGTGIYFAGVTGGTVQRNTLHRIRGVHGNGISVYQYSSGVRVDGNRLTECGSPITYEQSSDLLFCNNFVDCAYGQVNEWGGCFGSIDWLNNTIVNHGTGTHQALSIGREASASYIVRNNIVDGIAWQPAATVTRSHNIWLGTPTGYDPPEMQEGESVNSDLGAIFKDPANGIYSLAVASPAIGAAVDLSEQFETDIQGVERVAPWDIGAYEFSDPPETTPYAFPVRRSGFGFGIGGIL